mmetsp:Transcript_17882/g.29905  ORF Transcript_17882/g.29905 Transcript_17882/m.29905 type:complete len:534 (+) Transcript_17882:120-1721(+)
MNFQAQSTQLLPLPFTYFELREAARVGFTYNDRRFYWPHVVTFPPKAKVTELDNTRTVAQRMFDRVSRLSEFNDDMFEVRLSWPDDVGMVTQIMRAVTSHFPVSQPGLLEPLVTHVSRVLDDTAVCFYFFCSYMEKAYWYSIPNLRAHRYKLHTFRELCLRCMKNTHKILIKIGALEEQYLNLIFVDMLSELLPEKYFYQVLDMYFIEGYKILYRFGLALIKVNKSKIKNNDFRTGDEFWASVKRDSKHPDFDFTPLFNFAFDFRPNNFFKISIVPGRARLQKFEEATRAVMSDEDLIAPLLSHLPSTVDSSDIGLNCREGARDFLHHESSILDERLGGLLFSFLVPAARMEGFELMFSTSSDGWNLHTLYEKTRNHSPCILLIRTICENDAESEQHQDGGATIGMFLSCAMAPPSTSVRGDGTCFCFRLDGPDANCYRWAGHSRNSVEVLNTTEMQFAVCCNEYMAFGGSSRHGTNALRLSSDLMICDTGQSDTFGNPVLVPESKFRGHALKVSDVEVFCGKMSVTSTMKKV